MRPPRWFEKELKIIDDTYFIVFNRKYHYYEIKKQMNIIQEGHLVVVKPTLAVFRRLNDRALNNLRERKCEGRKYAGKDNEYLNHLKRLNEDAKVKKRELGMEVMAEGYVRIHNLDRRKTFT